MIVVTVARKPVAAGTVAANVLEHGAGALNIDATRLSYPSGKPESGWSKTGANGQKGYLDSNTFKIRAHSAEEIQARVAGGRWPANLILEHRPGCHITGAAMVRGDSRTPDYSSRQPGFYNIGEVQSDGRPRGTLHGDHEVPVWECEPGCPVADMDGQSGERPGMSGGGDRGDNKKTGNEVIPAFNRKPSAPFIRGDSGGASRFFKQVGGRKA